MRWTIAAPILWVLLISSVFYTLTSYWTGRLMSDQLAALSEGDAISGQWHAGLWRSEVTYRLQVSTPVGALQHEGRVEVRHNPVWQRDGWILARFSESNPEFSWQALWTLDERLLGSFLLAMADEPWQGSFSWTDNTLEINGARSTWALEDAALPMTVAHPFVSVRSAAPYDEVLIKLGGERFSVPVGDATLTSLEPQLSLQVHNFGETADWYVQWHSEHIQWQFAHALDTDLQVRLSALPWSTLIASLSDDPAERMAGWSGLLQSEPQLSRFGMRLDAHSPYEDFAGMLRVRGTQGLERWQDLDLEFSLLMYDQALYQLLLWQTLNSIAERGLTAPPESELERQVRRELRNTRLMLQLLPLVEVSSNKSEMHVQLRDGMLYQQGQPVMSLDQLQMLMPR